MKTHLRRATRTRVGKAERALPVSVAAVVAASLLGGLVGIVLPAPRSMAADLSLTLYGTAAGGWSFTSGAETNPGPTIVVSEGDRVTVHLISEDTFDHGLFIDFNDNGLIDYNSDVSSPTGVDVTFSFTVPASPGNHFYFCSIHSPNASGYYAPGAPMYGTFTVNGKPKASFSAPSAGASWTGGTPHDVIFNLQDEDPPTSLTVWVNYSYAGGAQRGTIADPFTGTTNPNVVSWTPTGFSAADVRISVTALDSNGAYGTSVSTLFVVDSIPPTILDRSPGPGAGNVARNANVRVTWSEPMSEAATGGPNAFAVRRTTDGAWVPGTVSRSPNATQMTFDPSGTLDATTPYDVFVNATARDASEPGNRLAVPETWQFTTGTVADTTPPTIQNVVANPSTQTVGGLVSLAATVTDDVDIASVYAHILGPTFDMNLTMVLGGGATWYANRTYANPGSYSVTVWALDGAGNVASQPGSFTIAQAPPPAAPATVTAHPDAGGGILVIWSSVTAGTVAGYNVYRATSSGGAFTKLTGTPVPAGTLEYRDAAVVPGVTYYYVVTSVDSVGSESQYSSAASASLATVPAGTDYALWAVAAAAIVAAGLAVIVVWRRKKR